MSESASSSSQVSTGAKNENSSMRMDAGIVKIDKAISRPWKGIVWHHSASPDGAVRDWPGIVKYHTSYRVDFNIVTKDEYDRRLAAKQGKSFLPPWRDVGYHGGIEMVDGHAMYAPGRPLSEIGAHAGVKNASNRFNTEYLGLCAIGNYDNIIPSEEIWILATVVTWELMRAFSIPATHVIGHREVYDLLGVPREKSCPGRFWDMEAFRKDLKEESHG